MSKNKQIFIFFLVCILIFNINSYNVNADEINVNARHAIAIDGKTKIILYEKNSDKLVPMASTTKIVTALVAIKYGKLDEKIEISANAASIRGSTVGYKKGEQITLRELLYGLMLRSGNDAAIAIAEGIGGNVEGFTKLMNEFASEIGIIDSHFESPHGLDSENHYSTAYDLAIATAKARENKVFNDIVKAKDVEAKEYGFTRSYHNINKILYQIPNADGVKTGYTGGAGKCLVTSINHHGNDIIIVVLNCTPRWQETSKIYKYVMNNYEYKKMFSKGDILDEVTINNDSIKMLCPKDIIIPMKKNSNYIHKIVKPMEVYTDIEKGYKLGSLVIYKDDEPIYSENLIAERSIKQNKLKKWWNIFRK